MYAMPLNNTANTIEKIVVKLKCFILNIAKSEPNKAPTKLINAIITNMKLIKHQSLPTGPTSKSRNLFIVYCIQRKIFFAKSFFYNCNSYKIHKITGFIQKRSIFINYLVNHIKFS
jgi:hypothetical protein